MWTSQDKILRLLKEKGPLTARQLAAEMGYDPDESRWGVQSVSSRLGWMRRRGLVRCDRTRPRLWKVVEGTAAYRRLFGDENA